MENSAEVERAVRAAVREELAPAVRELVRALRRLGQAPASEPRRRGRARQATAGETATQPRPQAVPLPAAAAKARAGSRPAASAAVRGQRSCSIRGCGRPRFSAGFCAGHYATCVQLEREGRRPKAWVAHARSGSLPELKER
ncbi:hypothetical protein FGE12_24775 [Aggregicoccus sp. 17bor-14]|uniref:hypothetical protein n=1 Tax=Myxococcaceae TaxID=31 RepID=UPI00129C7A02|nr:MULTISPECIES: hypothetical protein [Myxococcaceae]MBF5045644.1 hypothetical protein [Simulacricoccus sp. 17bor-14]MRI91381.1 hypothetical protein [Aggregicoccus sp. 17bor-14]